MKIGDYVRTKDGQIDKIKKIGEEYYERADDEEEKLYKIYKLKNKHYDEEFDEDNEWVFEDYIIKSSPNIINLIEYMDLLELKDPIKLYDKDTTIRLFNPVRCDGFITFEDGTHCIILNLDYIVDIKDLKIKSILTHEQYDSRKYKLGE